jgi:hypothetical protein
MIVALGVTAVPVGSLDARRAPQSAQTADQAFSSSSWVSENIIDSGGLFLQRHRSGIYPV